MVATPEIFGLLALAVLVLILLASLGWRLIAIQLRLGALSRVETKVDLLLKQAGIKFDPYGNLPAEIVEAVRAGQTIKAIKLYRESNGVGLKEAKDFIEEVQGRAGMR